MRPLWFVIAVLAPALALAQGTIYESKDKAGPVFSDQPSPGAKPVPLPPPNVIVIEPGTPRAPAPAAPFAYRKFAVVAPEPQGTIHSNTGAFPIKLAVEPPLRKGDILRVKLDGNLLDGRYTAPDIALTEADWAAAANPDNVEHRLQAAILDASGKLLIESAPVSFYVHRATRK
ncbi:MAG: DUF4124 domain-containing protein [Betaproteobacteria bacterium]